jgi:hypothetical protein
MRHFLFAVPEIVLYGCGILIAVAFAMSIGLFWQTWRVRARVRTLTRLLAAFSEASPAQTPKWIVPRRAGRDSEQVRETGQGAARMVEGD